MITRMLFSIACLQIVLLSCGGGGSDNPAPAATWQGPRNVDGYPDVAGTYSFSYAANSGNCTWSDGSQGTFFSSPHNVTITQTANSLILLEVVGTADIPGMTANVNQMSGTIDKNGHFISNQRTVWTTTTGTPGQIIADVNLDGNFTPQSWSGNYADKTTEFNGRLAQCTSTFSGDKL